MLELFDGKLEKLRLQKLLFLFSKSQTNPEYEFVPYKFGCFSFSAQADLTTMIQKGSLIEEENGLIKKDPAKYLAGLKEADRKALV
ncbi:MAG TPA: hypothetical protein VIM55_10710, partial [Mucilaginibacter sp.]